MDEANSKPAGKKPARKSAPARPRTAAAKRQPVNPVTVPAATATPENGSAVAAPRISPEERHRLIAEAAYFRASQRGFDGGAEVEDWLAAEAEIDGKLLGPPSQRFEPKRTL
jgi:hypothetical protein